MIRTSLLSLLLFSLLSCSQRTRPDELTTLIDQSQIRVVKIEQGNFFSPCEPSIAINPTNPDNIVAGAILDKVYVSNDGGQNWTKSKLESSFGVYGDPVIRCDYEGNFYYAHLSNPNGMAFRDSAFLDRIVIQKSSDMGVSWTDGSFTLPRTPKDQDKQWMVIDPETNDIYISWTEFDLYNSPLETHRSRILFSRSVDGGQSWSFPLVLSQKEGDCLDDDQTTEGAVPAIGPDGQVYVAWSYDEIIYFDKSYDKGSSWLEEDIVVAEQPGGWTYDVPGLMRCNGLPVTVADRSGGPYNGNVYVNWSDQRNGKDDTDIWLAVSSDEGESWTQPVRVNNDNKGRHQFLSWMDVDQTTGVIYIVFYDRRLHDDNTTDVFLAWSDDGGKSFKNIQINSESFEPNSMIFFGDYNDISVHQGRVRPIWTQLQDSRLSVWTALIN